MQWSSQGKKLEKPQNLKGGGHDTPITVAKE
jgi:hypothetical protein